MCYFVFNIKCIHLSKVLTDNSFFLCYFIIAGLATYFVSYYFYKILLNVFYF